MKQSDFEHLKSIDRKTVSCRCTAPSSEDAELVQVFHDLIMLLSNHMDPDDADILARSEIRGQTPPEIATQIGCSQAEATLRLSHARRCFCDLLILKLAPVNPE